MDFIKATTENADSIHKLVQHTIKKIYPAFYQKEIVEFFCSLHSKNNILKDIECENVYILTEHNQIIGTGSYENNHITRVYVNPEFQKQGYGTFIMQMLENEISKHYDFAYLDSSLPAKNMYIKRKYITIKKEKYKVKNGIVLFYDVMKKELK